MQFSIVLLKYARASLKNMPGWEQMLLYNMYTPFSTDSVFSDVQVASPYALILPHTIRYAGIWTEQCTHYIY